MIQKLSNGKILEYMEIVFTKRIEKDLWQVEISPDFAEIYNAHLDDTLPHMEFGSTKVKPSDVALEFAGGDYGEGIVEYAQEMFEKGNMPEEMVTGISLEKKF